MVRAVKESEVWTPEMFALFEKMEKIAEEKWLPYRIVFDKLGGNAARRQMPDEYYGLYRTVHEDGCHSYMAPTEYGGKGFTILQRGVLAAEKVKLGQSCQFDCIVCADGSFVFQTLKWIKLPMP